MTLKDYWEVLTNPELTNEISFSSGEEILLALLVVATYISIIFIIGFIFRRMIWLPLDNYFFERRMRKKDTNDGFKEGYNEKDDS